jgi:hypothetical protein
LDGELEGMLRSEPVSDVASSTSDGRLLVRVASSLAFFLVDLLALAASQGSRRAIHSYGRLPMFMYMLWLDVDTDCDHFISICWFKPTNASLVS